MVFSTIPAGTRANINIVALVRMPRAAVIATREIDAREKCSLSCKAKCMESRKRKVVTRSTWVLEACRTAMGMVAESRPTNCCDAAGTPSCPAIFIVVRIIPRYTNHWLARAYLSW